jgi:hypothetical protein
MGNQNLEKEGQRPTLRKKNNKGQTTISKALHIVFFTLISERA